MDSGSGTLASCSFRPWMRAWLLAAALYNLVWGACVVLAPAATLRLLGAGDLPPAGLSIWQCLGMVIGVYGVGYAAASLDPLRHWPIVLVGLLGKVLGPVGFAWCALRGEIPWSFGLTIPTNDLLWWIPFAGILAAAWRHASQDGTCAASDGPPMPLGTAMHAVRDQRGRTLAEASAEGPVLAVSVRHFGCTFCREALADLARDRAGIEATGARIAIIHTAPAADAERALARAGLAGIAHFADPGQSLTQALGVRRGAFLSLLGPRNVVRAIPALLAGHGIGYPSGDPMLLSSAFLVSRGRVVAHRHSAYAGERLDFRSLLPRAEPAPLAPDAAPAHT